VNDAGIPLTAFTRVPGYRFYSPEFWKEGETVVETYRMPVEKRYEGAEWRIGLEDPAGKPLAFAGNADAAAVDEWGRARILKLS
jgi:hypothetical protein